MSLSRTVTIIWMKLVQVDRFWYDMGPLHYLVAVPVAGSRILVYQIWNIGPDGCLPTLTQGCILFDTFSDIDLE